MLSGSPFSANIVCEVDANSTGHFVCKLTVAKPEGAPSVTRHDGQSVNHAVAIALENLAQHFRREAEQEQAVDWMAVEHSASGEAINKRFHLIVHYERIADDESKFEAQHNTLMGNTIVEQASVTVIQVDPDLKIEPIVHRCNEPE